MNSEPFLLVPSKYHLFLSRVRKLEEKGAGVASVPSCVFSIPHLSRSHDFVAFEAQHNCYTTLQNSGHVSGGRGGEGSRHNGEDEEDAWGAQAEGAHLCTAVGRDLVGQGGEKHQNTYFYPLPLSRRLRQTEKCLGWLSLRRDWLRLKRWLFGQGTQNQMKLHIVI